MKANDQARKPTAFTLEENPQLPIENEAEWAPSRSGCFGEESVTRDGNWTTIHGIVARSTVTITGIS